MSKSTLTSHQTYLSPTLMKLTLSPTCNLRTEGLVGSFMHMFWSCKEVSLFWKPVCTFLARILDREVPCNPTLLVLNNLTLLYISQHEKFILLSGLMAAKSFSFQDFNKPALPVNYVTSGCVWYDLACSPCGVLNQ